MVHDEGGDGTIIGHGILPHCLEGGVAVDILQDFLRKLLPQKPHHFFDLSPCVLSKTRNAVLPGNNLSRFFPRLTSYLHHVLVEDIKNSMTILCVPPAQDVVKPTPPSDCKKIESKMLKGNSIIHTGFSCHSPAPVKNITK